MRLHDDTSNPSAGTSSPGRVLALAALATGVAYLLWRLTTLGGGLRLVVSVPLWLAEISALVHLALIVRQAWSVPRRRETPDHPETAQPPALDVVVTAHDATVADLERTLVGCAELNGHPQIHVIDHRHRPRAYRLAQSHGATYTVGSVAAGLASPPGTTAPEFVLWLAGGAVPMPGLLARVLPAFADERVAIVQVAVDLLNPDSLTHMTRGRDEQAFEREVTGPADGTRGVGPWLGSGSVIRRSALEDVGGLDETLTASIDQTLVRLHRAGWRSVFEPSALVRTTAPDRLHDYLGHRRERALASYALLTSAESPLRERALTMPARRSHLARGLTYVSGIRVLTYATAMVVTLLTGAMPFAADARLVAALWLITTLLGALTRRALARGTMALGDWTRQAWRTVGADVSALGLLVGLGKKTDQSTAEHGLRSLGRLRLLTGAVVALDLALVARALTLIDHDLLPAFTTSERVLALGFGIAMLVPMIDVLAMHVRRTQRRAFYRRAANLPIEFAGQTAETLDLTPHGVGVASSHAPPVGEVIPFRLLVPRRNGSSTMVEGSAKVRAATTMSTGVVRIGMEFENLDADARAALIRYCAIDHAVLTGEEVGLPEVDPQDLEPNQPPRQTAATRALTGIAMVLALVTLGFGPGAQVARAAAPVSICLHDSAGGPLSGGTAALRTETGATPLGTTGADGCVVTEEITGAATIDMTVAGVQRSVTQDVSANPSITFTTTTTLVRVLQSSGAPIEGARVRVFHGRWHDLGLTGADGAMPAHLFAEPYDFEITWKGGRMVRLAAPTADQSLTVRTARLVADPGQAVRQVDLGDGWQTFTDGMEVLPGDYAFRLGGGGIAKLSAPAGHQLSAPSGTLVPIEPSIEPPTVGTDLAATTTTGSPAEVTTTTTTTATTTTVPPKTSVDATTSVAPTTTVTPPTTTSPPATTTAGSEAPTTSIGASP